MKEAELEKEGEVMEEDQRGSSMDKGSSVSDEKGGVKSPGRMKCTACVSLCCTKQSQAKHLSLSQK